MGARGEGRFAPISWEEAYDLVERRFNDIKASDGAESVIFVQGTGRDIGGPITFLAYSFGSPNWCQLGLSGQSCYTPRLGSMKAVMGDFAVVDCSQFLEKRYEDPRWVRPEVIIVWGQHPANGCPDAFYGHWIVDCMKRGSKIISVEPRHTWLSSRAVHHLQLRPGTDGALALGMLNVIIGEGRYDKAFVERWVHGFDELAQRARQFPVDKVAAITEAAMRGEIADYKESLRRRVALGAGGTAIQHSVAGANASVPALTVVVPV